VDGLLGIGVAGGNSAANLNEGAILAARLEEMRKERDNRSKVNNKSQSPVLVSSTSSGVSPTARAPSKTPQKPNRPGKKKAKK
jgi:hypothetical protein